jgi:hypothetical protein
MVADIVRVKSRVRFAMQHLQLAYRERAVAAGVRVGALAVAVHTASLQRLYVCEAAFNGS